MTWYGSFIIPVGDLPQKGYHLNIAPEIMTEELEAFRVNPANGATFMGSSTVFLRFKNEKQAREALPGYWFDP